MAEALVLAEQEPRERLERQLADGSRAKGEKKGEKKKCGVKRKMGGR